MNKLHQFSNEWIQFQTQRTQTLIRLSIVSSKAIQYFSNTTSTKIPLKYLSDLSFLCKGTGGDNYVPEQFSSPRAVRLLLCKTALTGTLKQKFTWETKKGIFYHKKNEMAKIPKILLFANGTHFSWLKWKNIMCKFVRNFAHFDKNKLLNFS